MSKTPLPDEIDDIVHGRVRLAILTFLSTNERAEFTTLKKTLSITDGNLSLHLRKLEDAGYVTISKDFVERRPRTTAVLNKDGRKALATYVKTMRALIDTIPAS